MMQMASQLVPNRARFCLLPLKRLTCLLLFWLLVSLQNSLAQTETASASDDGPSIPAWVADSIAGRQSGTGRVWVSEFADSARLAAGDLQNRVVADVVRWCRRQPAGQDLDLAHLDWELIRSLLDNDSYWLGISHDPGTESQWRGAAKLELDDPLLEKITRSLELKTRLKRVEQLLLVLMAATGTVIIVWVFLVLDHKTRHHFSRRFQTLAVIAWITMGFAIATVWWWAFR